VFVRVRFPDVRAKQCAASCGASRHGGARFGYSGVTGRAAGVYLGSIPRRLRTGHDSAVLGSAATWPGYSRAPQQTRDNMEFRITLTGSANLLMHNARLCNPLDPATKALKKVTSKTKKTDDDHIEVARLEHGGSLYMDSVAGPYIPGENLQRCLTDAAKVTRSGVKVTRGVFISSDVNPLGYRGPRDVEGLWQDENFRLMAPVKVGTARVMRCRPMFPAGWMVSAEGFLDTEILSFEDLSDIASTAGRLIGMGDWRPRYGRFTATVEEI
jgi:hypothetical protein